MSKSDILLSSGKRIATDAIIETAETRHRQRVVVDPATFAVGTVAPAELLSAPLVDDEDDSNLAVDGSSDAVEYSYVVPVGKIARVAALDITLAAPLTDGSDLTNGLLVHIRDAASGVVVDLTAGAPVASQTRLGVLGAITTIASGVTFVRLDLVALTGHAVALAAGESIAVTVQDDLTGIGDIVAMVRGRVVDAS